MDDSPQQLFEQAKAYLLKGNENGESLYDLLSEAILYLQENASSSGVIDFDQVLHTLQEDKFRSNDIVKPKTFGNLWALHASDNRELCSTILKLLSRRVQETKLEQKQHEEEVERKKKEAEEKENDDEQQEEDDEVNPNINYLFSSINGLSDVLEESKLLSVAGIGFVEGEAYQIQLSMAHHKLVNKLRRVRFVGKIIGLRNNYYIIESENVPFPQKNIKLLKQEAFVFPKVRYNEKNLDTYPPEEAGTGANQFSYWVCNHIGDPWIQLPDIHPKQIRAARLIRKYFTGDLTERVNSYPPFPGNEANYLRAQITRIVSSCLIAPAIFDQFVPEEGEDDEEEPKKEIPIYPDLQVKGADDIKFTLKEIENLENWQHLSPHLRVSGRLNRYVPPAQDDEEQEEEDPNPDLVERLRTLNLDSKYVLPGMKPVKKKKKKTTDDDDDEGDEEDADQQEEEEEEEDSDADPEAKSWKPTVRMTMWTIRLFNKVFAKENTMVLISSKRWPGAHCVTNQDGKKFANVYIGTGHKETFGSFTPLAPPAVLSEMKDPIEQKDPSARNEKRVLAGDEPIDDNAPDDDANDRSDDEDNDDDQDSDDD
jgi:radial spoke head protein 4A